MSELKAIRSEEIYNIIEYEDCYRTDDLYYLKSEADKVIAELEEELQAANEQIENLINSASSIMLFQDRVNDNKCDELRHHKYKRCFAMAKWCAVERDIYNLTPRFAKVEFYRKWQKRWLELAEKFKENV